jgi:hypothetical protein
MPETRIAHRTLAAKPPLGRSGHGMVSSFGEYAERRSPRRVLAKHLLELSHCELSRTLAVETAVPRPVTVHQNELRSLEKQASLVVTVCYGASRQSDFFAESSPSHDSLPPRLNQHIRSWLRQIRIEGDGIRRRRHGLIFRDGAATMRMGHGSESQDPTHRKDKRAPQGGLR